MIISKLQKHLPEWIEATSIVISGFVVIIILAVGLYDKVNNIDDKLDHIVQDDIILGQRIMVLESVVFDNRLEDAKMHQFIEDCCDGKKGGD